MRTMYDAVDPTQIPKDATMVAGYLDGTESKWPAEAWSWFPNAVPVYIVVNPATNAGHVLDVEPGNWNAAASVDWTVMRRASGLATPAIYCGNWAPGYTMVDVFNAHDARGVARPMIWLASWDGIADIPAGCIAKQYMSVHTSVNYDVSVVADYWPGVDPSPLTVDVVRKYAADASAQIANAQTALVKALESLNF